MRRRADPEASGPSRTQSDGGPASRRDDERTPLSSAPSCALLLAFAVADQRHQHRPERELAFLRLVGEVA